MRYATVCSGIEAPTQAWHGLGWEPVWFSEIERFPSAVLKHHYPEVPNLGDMTKIHEDETYQKTAGTIDIFCGGTPCQSFSVAGLRKGLEDPRGNLALHFLRIVDDLRPRWVVWENVPGVLSSSGGRDFGSFLGALGQLGYGFAYRVLDAQYFGVAQRRRRVFVVGYIGGWRGAAAVLFDTESLRGNPSPGREAGQGIAGRVAPCLNGNGKAAGSATQQDAENGALVYAYQSANNPLAESEVSATLRARNGTDERSNGAYIIKGAAIGRKPAEVAPSIDVGKSDGLATYSEHAVRRLTPRECERLQGFPDSFTRIPYRNKPASQCPDGPRYKALGNSMAVPVMRWIGEQIQRYEEITT